MDDGCGVYTLVSNLVMLWLVLINNATASGGSRAHQYRAVTYKEGGSLEIHRLESYIQKGIYEAQSRP